MTIRTVFLPATVAVLMAGLAAPAAGQGTKQAAVQVPTGWEVLWKAQRWEGLLAEARPALAFDDLGEPTFVWTGVEKGGKRWFQVATAQWAHIGAGESAWAIVRSADDQRERGFGWLPLTTVKVGDGIPVRKGLVARSWARVVTADAAHGTIYELELYWESGEHGAQGNRLILWQDPRGNWRYAGTLPGDSWDLTGFRMQYRVAADFAGPAEQPLRLRVEQRYEAVDSNGERLGLRWGESSSLGGALPLNMGKPVARDFVVEVRKGETFTGVVREEAAMAEEDHTEAAQARARQVIALHMRALNPHVNMEQLRVGQVLRTLASWQWAETLAGKNELSAQGTQQNRTTAPFPNSPE